MTTRNIDEQLRQYYGEVALDAASLGRLRGLLDKPAQERAEGATRGGIRGAWQIVALAASISVLFLAGALLLLRKPAPDVPQVAGLSERLAAEVVSRHGKCVDEIDFRAEDLEKLFAQMGRVDFVAGVPHRRGLDRMKVKGAHYCVLDGRIAIHVVLVDGRGELVSLFETKAGAELASLRAATHRIGSSDVELWQASGVLYAAALPAPTT